MKRLRIIIDRYVPFIEGVLEPYADVTYLTPAEITPEAVRDADALIVRTRTRIDETLLGNSKCRFVATATIGMDHFDMDYCHHAGVTAVNAPGCNAPAVAQYVMASIASLINRPISQHTLAIVGVGHVGSLVERWARALDMRIVLVDPPRQRAEGGEGWSTLAEAATKADIITFHTPLTREGLDATYHLADEAFFRSLRRNPIVINSARGPVVDNRAWLEAIRRGDLKASVVDTWEGEPLINKELMHAADIATPHIAGYSMEGKIRATQMVLDALTAHFGLPALKADAPEAAPVPESVKVSKVLDSYDPGADTAMMRVALDATLTDNETRRVFEHLRDDYDLRAEVSAARID